MNEELENLRSSIDKTDQELITLLKRRMQLVSRVGEVKSRIGVPVYAPEREATMLANRRREAEKHGLSPQLIEDVLRRIMRESYSSEHDAGFKCVNPAARNIVILPGFGIPCGLSEPPELGRGSQDAGKSRSGDCLRSH